MTELENWLKQATKCLSEDSAGRVRTEIEDHFESARAAGQSHAAALEALGDPKAANRAYRRVLLTREEATLLREGNGEAIVVCTWLPWVPVALLGVIAALYLTGLAEVARDALILSLGVSPILLSPILPIYTAARSRVFRWVKVLALVSAMALLTWPIPLKLSWLIMTSGLWFFFWTEWTRASIRRKLPVKDWPRQLYI
jgi:hypothetical protein